MRSDFFLLMIEKFLDYLSVEKRYSAHTVKSYRKDLQDFASFLKESEGSSDLLTVEKLVIRNFIVYLTQQNLSKRSINRKISALKSFYLFLLKIDEITKNPTESISSIKFYPEKQIPMSEEEMDALQSYFEKKPNLLKECLIETLYQTGMRKAELCHLSKDSVNFENLEISVLGKGNKSRIIPISGKLAQKLHLYFTAERHASDADQNYFFVNRLGRKLTEKFVYSVVNFYLSLVTVKKKKSPHMLRHTFATHVLEHDAEISKIKKIMGHSSLASTQVYTSANIEQMKRVLNSAHPRSKK